VADLTLVSLIDNAALFPLPKHNSDSDSLILLEIKKRLKIFFRAAGPEDVQVEKSFDEKIRYKILILK